MESCPFLTQRPRALCCRQNDVKFHSVLQNLRVLSLPIGLQVPFSYFLSSRNPFWNLLITCTQKQQWIVKRTFNAECSKSPVGRCPALDLWRRRFLVNPVEPRFWQTASLHNCKDSIVCSCFKMFFEGQGYFYVIFCLFKWITDRFLIRS